MKDNQSEELTGVKEIARRANVSIGTVDRVLHNRNGVSLATRDKVLAIIKELDYQPNIMARRLASKKVLHIAVLIPAVSEETDYWAAPLKGIEEAEAEIKTYGIVLEKYFFDLNDKQTFHKQTAAILQNNADGVLMAPMHIEESRLFADACSAKNIPCVFINSDIPGQKSLCYIGPDLHHSGSLGAHLIHYLVSAQDQVLIVNISKEIDNLHHLLRKEEGFRAYFKKNNFSNPLIKADIRDTDYLSVKRTLTEVLSKQEIKAIFVTNSRVFSVARFLEEANATHIKLVGYDFLQSNVDYLEKGTIEFLISQKPKEQGYKGIITLYNYLVHDTVIDKTYFMPIDILTKENYTFYKN